MLRNSEEHGCLVLDRGSEAQRSWSSARGREISLSPGVHLGVTDEVMGMPHLQTREGEGQSCSEGFHLWLVQAPVEAERDVEVWGTGEGEYQAQQSEPGGQCLPIPTPIRNHKFYL